MYGYIYKITINNEKSKMHNCYYIGQHVSSSFDKNYWGSGILIKEYFNKYSHETAKIEVLCECIDKKELDSKEKEYISDLYETDAYSNGGKCLNLKAGGDSAPLSEDLKKILSEARKGENNPFYGKTHSEELKALFSKKYSGEGNPMYGKTHSIEARIKISNSKKGKKYTEEQKLDCIKRLEGRKWYNNGIKSIALKEGDEIPEGFKPGRFLSEECKLHSSLKNKEFMQTHILCNNGKEHIYIKKGDPIPEGFVKGQIITDKQRKAISEAAKNRIWYNNGIVTKGFKEGEIIPEGFVKGRVKVKTKSTTGYHWYNNGKERLYLKDGQHIPEGFIKGNLKKINKEKNIGDKE